VRPLHVLLLEVFVGPRPNGFFACHKDDCRTNCSLENLYWGTPTQNGQDRGINGGAPKLAPRDIETIRELRDRGWSQPRIANVFGVRQDHISRILSGEHWTYV
jgi:hypothetical protein